MDRRGCVPPSAHWPDEALCILEIRDVWSGAHESLRAPAAIQGRRSPDLGRCGLPTKACVVVYEGADLMAKTNSVIVLEVRLVTSAAWLSLSGVAKVVQLLFRTKCKMGRANEATWSATMANSSSRTEKPSASTESRLPASAGRLTSWLPGASSISWRAGREYSRWSRTTGCRTGGGHMTQTISFNPKDRNAADTADSARATRSGSGA